MLEELSKRDKEWRKIALHICKDKNIADEITQQMYLEVYKYSKNKINSFYIYVTLRNLFYKNRKENKRFLSISEKDVLSEAESQDQEKEYIDIIERLNIKLDDLPWYDREVLLLNNGRTVESNGKIKKVIPGVSYRKLEKKTSIKSMNLFNTTRRVKEKLKKELEPEYKKWQQKRIS